MKRVACPICNMRGRVFGNDLCTNCAGTGFVPGYGGPPSPPAPPIPLPRRLRAVILVLALAGGVVAYVTSGRDLQNAGLGFLLLLVTGLVLAHAARNLVVYLMLAAGVYGLDQVLWDGQAVPWGVNAGVGIITQVYATVF